VPPLLALLSERLGTLGGLTTEGIFRVSAPVATLDELAAQLFPAEGIDCSEVRRPLRPC
jgi:hypothetical protein